MGMSATQARLLSITSRLTNNEFRSQTITNSKLRLATESQEASQAYMDALDSKQIMFMSYDDNGEASKTPLTAAVLYDYAPMKNQYMITNTAGKYLVSGKDVENFEDSKDLFKFLEKYDLVDSSITSDYDEKLKKYNKDLEKYNKDYADWKPQHDAYEKAKSEPSLYDDFVAIMGTSDNPQSCYARALSNGPAYTECYVHVLAHLLEWPGDDTCSNKEFKTSTGKPVKLETDDITGAGMHDLAKEYNYKGISDAINDEEKYLCDRDDVFIPASKNGNKLDTDKQNNLKTKLEKGEELTEKDLLLSDYKYDASTGEFTVKSIKQKAIDLLYVLKNNGNNPPYKFLSTQEEIRDTLINFTDGDLRGLQVEDPGDMYPKPVPPSEPIIKILVKDQERAQWYVNLWYAMNGSDTANVVDPINFDNDDEYLKTLSDDIKQEFRFTVENSTKDIHHTNYEVIDMNLNDSAEWLEFALEHGAVTLQQTKYYNPAEDNNKTANLSADGYYWENIVYTSARDFVTIDDEKAIAIAEVKYKKAITEIENKDKKFDQDLKKLDTEHNALQTEYESMKEVLSKNVQRSFKAFS